MGVNRDDGSLSNSIDSILGQSFQDFEFLVLNDGNGADVLSVVETYTDPRLIHIPLEKMGLTRALNEGILKARAPLIARQDAGDLSLPQRLSEQLEYFKTHPDLGLMGSAVIESTVDGDHLGDIIFPESSSEIKAHLPFQNPFCHGSVMFRTEVVKKAGLYREPFIKAQDYDLWLRLAEQTEMHNLPQILYNRIVDKDSISIRTKKMQSEYAALARESAQARSKGLPEPELNLFSTPVSEKHISAAQRDGTYYLHCGRLLLTNRRRQEARSLFLRSISYWPFHFYAYIFLLASFIPAALIDGVELMWKRFQKRWGIQV